MNWKPLESAPRNGEPFLIRTERLGLAIVVNDPYDPMPVNLVPSGLHLQVYDGKDYHPIRGDYPTEWTELPHG